MPRKAAELSGKKFSRLTVIRRDGNYMIGDRKGPARWECRCDCGNIHYGSSFDLMNNKIQSCGCLNQENRTKHNMYKTKTYSIWGNIVQRCTNPKHTAWKYYGGRGIKYCNRWRKFENFYADMGECPSSDHTIDRRDTNKGYSKNNCRWATLSEQQQNKRPYINWNQKLTDDDVREILTSSLSTEDLANKYGVSKKHMYSILAGHHFKHIKL